MVTRGIEAGEEIHIHDKFTTEEAVLFFIRAKTEKQPEERLISEAGRMVRGARLNLCFERVEKLTRFNQTKIRNAGDQKERGGEFVGLREGEEGFEGPRERLGVLENQKRGLLF